MIKHFFYILICGIVLITGCNQQAPKTESKQNITRDMASSESVQQAFSDGRIKVIRNDEKMKHSILQNSLKEQEMMMTDSELSSQLVGFNIKMNQMMTNGSAGKEQLMQSTLQVMEGINADSTKNHHLVKLQSESRKKALKDPALQNQLLQQSMHERFLALENPTTSRNAKELSLKTTEAIFHNKDLKTKMLAQDIQRFNAITATPYLRSEMADAMLPLLKNPKIAKELEAMIKMAVAAEMNKVKLILQQQQMKQQQMKQEKPETSSEKEKIKINNIET